MPETRTLDEIVASLSADLRPVRRLPAPSLRAALWVGVAATMAAGLALCCDLDAMTDRLKAAPDMWLAVLGSTFTAVLGAVAAFQLSVPGRGAWWGLLPLPSLMLWMGASGMGCLRTWVLPGADATLVETRHCLTSILLLSVPLMALMVVMLRRACPLHPHLTALVSGVAIAAASATLLNFFHPYDASAADLVVHLVAVLLVVALNQVLWRRGAASNAKTMGP